MGELKELEILKEQLQHDYKQGIKKINIDEVLRHIKLLDEEYQNKCNWYELDIQHYINEIDYCIEYMVNECEEWKSFLNLTEEDKREMAENLLHCEQLNRDINEYVEWELTHYKNERG